MTPDNNGAQRIAATTPEIWCTASGYKPLIGGDIEVEVEDGVDATLSGTGKLDTDAGVDDVGSWPCRSSWAIEYAKIEAQM